MVWPPWYGPAREPALTRSFIDGLRNRAYTRDMKHIILAATAALISATLPASADSDHDRALQALRSGEVLSLRTILDKAATDFPGDLIEAELEHEDDRTIYEIKLLTPEGQVLKLEYDARTGVLLKTKEKKPR